MKISKTVFYSILSVFFLTSMTLAASGFSYGKKKAESAPAQSQPSAESKPLRAKSSPGAAVFFVDLKDGATVTSPLLVKFGAKGLTVAPAGEVKDNSGHHHLLIDVEKLPPMDQPLPVTDKIVHFGKAQDQGTITLSPGPHTLQLLFAGGNHVPLNPPVMSKKIKIVVK
jgi:hypothetical protein